MLIVIISGAPCTGKTTLGKRLASDLRLPFLSKDAIKERLFDTLGWSDRAWSRKLGAATMELLFLWAETELAAGRSFVLEANFRPEQANEQFRALGEKYPFTAAQVLCQAETDVLLARYKRRTESGERHPGHVDHITYPEVMADLTGGVYGPLALPGPVCWVDTTNFEQVDYEGLLEAIRDL